MDEETLNKTLKQQYAELPNEIKQVVKSEALHDYVEEFARQRRLTISQMRLVENEFMMVLIGLERLPDLRENLLEHTDLDENLVDMIYTLVYENIFEPLEESFQSLYRRQDAAEQLAGMDGDVGIKSEEDLDRESLLKGIEEPEEAKPRGNNYQSNQTTMSELSEDKNRPTDDPSEGETVAPKEAQKEAKERGYQGGDDPYREPFDEQKE